MSINEKYLGQASEATTRLGIDTNLLSPSKKDKPVIFLGGYSGESITLAKAIKDIAQDVSVVLMYYSSRSGDHGFVELENDALIPTLLRDPDYEHNQQECEDSGRTGNAHNIQRLCGDKFLTNFILRRNGIPVPKQTRLPSETDKEVLTSKGKVYPLAYYDGLTEDEFCNGHVVKPRNGCGGNGVILVRYGNERSMIRDVLLDGCVIEELIESYPIEFFNGKKDWNLRALVTYDPKKGRYITAGITGRLANEGGPVNRSRGAENISFEDLAKLCGWSEEEFLRIKGEVMRTAELSSEILVQAGNRKNIIPKYTNFQTLFGVDIIINKDMKPYVIEVNASDSGCIYELCELEGIESIYPIAQAVIHKTRLINNIPQLYECLKTIADQIGMDYHRLAMLYNSGEIIITDNPDGSFGVHIPEEFLIPGNPQ